ncbi:MAG: hypothetical protein CR967_04935 [Proteobacteria bacterium]|nr:MAG: hypothetical protein CR967_04935 [Pseudomonadota bacterium]
MLTYQISLGILVLICIFLIIAIFSYQSSLKKEKQNTEKFKKAALDAQKIIAKYKSQLERSLETIDTLHKELLTHHLTHKLEKIS